MALLFFVLYAQIPGANLYGLYDDYDMSLNSDDIFTSFYDDVETGKVLEDERFFSYGRFFAINFGIGMTTFDGNRGNAYENELPSFRFSFMLFSDIQTSIGFGYEYSKHNFYLAQGVRDFHSTDPTIGVGQIDVSMSRLFLLYRYYLNIRDLGTAITFSNPYLTIRGEYWMFVNNFIDQSTQPRKSGGGFGMGVGGGLEFPIKIQESYFNLELLYHVINFSDKNTGAYGPYDQNSYGYEDLSGNSYSATISYVFNW
jgi:hypothetical protein